MRTDFKVYKRKIHVFRESNELDGRDADRWIYVWTTNAHPTCKSALLEAKATLPTVKFKASFAR